MKEPSVRNFFCLTNLILVISFYRIYLPLSWNALYKVSLQNQVTLGHITYWYQSKQIAGSSGFTRNNSGKFQKRHVGKNYLKEALEEIQKSNRLEALKFCNQNNRKICRFCSKLAIKTPERRHQCCSCHSNFYNP